MYNYRNRKLDISDKALAGLLNNTGLHIDDKLIDTLVSNAYNIYPNSEEFKNLSNKDIKDVINNAAEPINKEVFS